MSVADWYREKMRTLSGVVVGDDAPDWMQGGLVAWAETNPFYQAAVWLGEDEATEHPPKMIDQYPDLKEEMVERWNQKFWMPLYGAVCGMSLPDYNTYLGAIKGRVQDMAKAYGPEFIADWYTVTPDGLDVAEYARRRGELGCSLPPAEVNAVMRQLVPGSDLPLVPTFPGGVKAQAPQLGLVALGATVLVGAAGLVYWWRRRR